MSQQERLAVLRMLSEGKINPREAEMLLRAIGKGTTSTGTERDTKEATAVFDELTQEIKQEVSKAVESLQRSNIGKMVSEVVNDVVAQVRASVSNVTDEGERSAAQEKVEEALTWTFDSAGITDIDAQTTNGDIKLEGTEDSQINVRAWKTVRGRDKASVSAFAGQVVVSAEQEDDTIRVYNEHPKPPQGVSVEVRYEIDAPCLINANLRTVNGEIQVNGTDGSVDVTTVNGGIGFRCDTGPIHAHTTNGDIKGEIGRFEQHGKFATTNGKIVVSVQDGSASLGATTTNGSIDLTLPQTFAGQLDARTSSGRVHSDSPIPYSGNVRNRLEGQIGEGGDALVKLRSLNGSISLKRS